MDNNDNAFEYDQGHNFANQRNEVEYTPGDHCKRHRKPDGFEKTEEVTTYRRRKPR